MFEFILDVSLKTGFIIIPLFLMGLWGWFILLKTYTFLKIQEKPATIIKWDKFVLALETENLAKLKKKFTLYQDCAYAEFILMILNNLHTSERHLQTLHNGFMIKKINKHLQNLKTVKIFAATAPLLGLLGTVIGMIHTFNIISLYGNANPVLMADGISEALLTTQSGLIVAFPLLFMYVIFNNKLKRLNNAMNDVVTEINHSRKLD
ncbi:MAG TPA: MotA/TolQ/ExbB proton channel family protein [Spirochaetota bacterium]|nr:MotA/TolQ/ExbB proton channel family protein [Spirochaetota bacterium]